MGIVFAIAKSELYEFKMEIPLISTIFEHHHLQTNFLVHPTMKKIFSITIFVAAALLWPGKTLALDFRFTYELKDTLTLNSCTAISIQSAANRLAKYIKDSVTVHINVEVGNLNGAFATGGPTGFTTYPSGLTLVNRATLTFDSTLLVQAMARRSEIQALVMHELIHCLGMVSDFNAYKKHIIQDTLFNGPMTVAMNYRRPVILSEDLSHFKRGQTFPFGFTPCMLESSASFYTCVDLAVLYDIGYSIPSMETQGGAYLIGFQFASDCAAIWNRPFKPQICCPNVVGTGTNQVVRGYSGNDLFQGGMDLPVTYYGFSGDDTFAENGFTYPMTIYGDSPYTWPQFAEYLNFYYITAYLPDTIYFGNRDIIRIDTSYCSITPAQLASAAIEKTNTYFSSKGTYYQYKYTIDNQCQKLSPHIEELVLILYSKQQDTDSLKSRIRIGQYR